MSSKRLATLLATIRLLYRCHPRAFLTSCLASLPEPLLYPAIVLVFLGLIGVAVTLLTLAPLLVVAMVLIALPAGLIERRFSRAMYELQEHNAPNQLRMEVLTNMQVDASWQRDVRVYRSDLIPREHARLA